MADDPTSHLRNRPRQARSVATVELLLDVAEEVFEEVGYDAATTNLVASRAEVPVGTLYRWFPDKAALAEALTDRYLQRLVALYDEVLGTLEPAEHIGGFLHRVVRRVVEATREQRALTALLVSTMVPGGGSPAGTRLRDGLEGHVRGLVELRVPGIPPEVRDQTAEVCVALVYLVIAASTDEDRQRGDRLSGEFTDAMLAYLEAKFPVAGHPAWTDPDVPIAPLFPAPDRAARLASEQ